MKEAVPHPGQPVCKPRIMLVDDEESIRVTITKLLASEGIDIITATGANDCLRQLRGGFRGVILMDVMMPGMDGWATIREMQKVGLLQGNIICMLTALDAPDERMEGLQEVIIDYMTKPFERTPFVSAVREYLTLMEQQKGAN